MKTEAHNVPLYQIRESPRQIDLLTQHWSGSPACLACPPLTLYPVSRASHELKPADDRNAEGSMLVIGCSTDWMSRPDNAGKFHFH